MKNYETFSTTADVGIRVWGMDCGELCRNALAAFNELVFGKRKKAKLTFHFHPFEYMGDSTENVLVNFLLEVLFLTFEKRHWVLDCKINQSGDRSIDTQLFYTDWPSDPLLEIKSITYHNLLVRDDNGRKKLEVVLDI